MPGNICSALLHREMTGTMSTHSRLGQARTNLPTDRHSRPEEPVRPRPQKRRHYHHRQEIKDINDDGSNKKIYNKLLNIRIRIDEVIPKYALQSGHIVMGFSHCNRYILSYTIRPVQHANIHNMLIQNENRPILEFDVESLYTYKLYFWLFTPFSVAKKYSSVLLFDRNGTTDSNLLIQMCQWKYEEFSGNDKFLAVVGKSSTPEENPRCYLTLTQLPPSSPCTKCTYSAEYTQVLNPCLSHSLTVTLTYELVSPYPKFDPEVSLYLTDGNTPTILINTGNLFHQIQFNPSQGQIKQNKSNVLKTDLNQSHPDLNFYYKNLLPTCDTKERRFFKRTKPPNPTLPKEEKPDIYDLLLNEDDGKVDKNYRLFRTRQLADKKYDAAFKEEICKYDDYVLRPLHNSNKRPQHRSTISKPGSSSKTIFIKRCTARVTRSYVLLNEESVSTTTEIEDNEYNFNEFPVALPTNVYTDQTQLSMIPNYKAVDKKVLITQTSLDFEILSNEIANIICNKEDAQFAFLIDFDAIIVQTHPIDCTITALVILLIQATTAKDENIENNRLSYETNYILQWNPSTQSAKVLFKGKLQVASNKFDQVWNPTEALALSLQSMRLYKQDNPHLNNNQMVYDWISADELSDSNGIVTLYREVIQTSTEEYFDDDDIISLLSDDE